MFEKNPGIKEFLETITSDFKILFGENLLGIYLTGSLTYDAYKKGLSDIDVIVVIDHKLDENKIRELNAWCKKIIGTQGQAQYLDAAFVEKQNILLTDGNTQKNAFEFYKGKISEGNNTLGDNLLVWSNILESGITLYGVDPHKIINDISDKHLRNVMLKELVRLKELMNESFENDMKFRYYAVTTLCRMQYTNEMKGFVSKKEALDWYSKEIGNHENLITAAGKFIESNEKPIVQTNREEYNQFINETENVILATAKTSK